MASYLDEADKYIDKNKLNQSSASYLDVADKYINNTSTPTSMPESTIPAAPAKKYNTGFGWLDTVGNALDSFNNLKPVKGFNVLGLGIQKGTGINLLNRLADPEVEKADQAKLDAHPIIGTVGQGIGYLAPFGAAGKVVSKIPALAKPAATTLGRIGQGAAKGTLEGLMVGGAMGAADEATRDIGLSDLVTGNDKRDILGKALKEGATFGVGGALFGGAGSAIGEGLGKLALNKQLKNIYNAYNSMSQQGLASFNPNAIQSQSTLSKLVGNIKPPLSTNNSPVGQINPSGLPNTESRIVSSQNPTNKSLYQKASDKWNNFYTNWIDSQNPIKQFSNTAKNDTAYKTAINSKKVNSTVDYIINKGLVDREGKKVGESFKDIVQSIPKEKEIPFVNYLLHKHNINRVAENKPIFKDYSPEASNAEVFRYEQANPEFKQIGDRLNKFLNDFGDKWMKDAGLTSDVIMQDLRAKYPNYIPTQREFSELEKGFSGGAKSGYVDQPSGIRNATGSDRNVLNPLENIMNLINRTVRTARRNEVGQEIVKSISQNPQALSKYAEILPPNYQGRLDLDNIVTVRMNGEPVHLKINDKNFLETINGAETSNNLPIDLSYFNNKFKGLITQNNPVFAVRNIARDLPTSYIYGTEKNPLKFGKDLFTAGKEILTKGKQYEQYQALGGGSSNFFSPDKVTASKEALINPKLNLGQKTLKGIQAFNNFTETVPRLAEFQRTLKKGGTIQDALYNSGETTVNFARGGEKAKSLDKSLVPYLNASIQGLDRFARGVKSNPLGMAAKGITAITAPTVIQEVWNQTKDPEGYKALDNRTKDNYFVFAQGDGKFLKIPKSRELAVLFSSLFQRVYRQAKGEDNAFKGFGNTIATNFSPTNPIESNILAPATLNLYSNKDFADRDIVPQYMQNLSPELQYDEKTSEIAKKIGEVTKLSPKQIDYIIRSYTGVIGQMGLPAATKGGDTFKPITSQFQSDAAYSNQNVTDFYDNLNKLKTVAADRNVRENIPTGVVTPEERLRDIFQKQSDRMSMLRKYAKDGTEEEKRQAQKEIAELSKYMNDILK